MYKALVSFTTIKSYNDVQKGEILESDFDTQEEIEKYLNIGYIAEYDGTIEITENGTYDVTDYESAEVNVSGGGGGSDLDWSVLGYDSMPQDIINYYNEAKEIQRTWVPTENLSNKYQNNLTLYYFPLVDTSITTNMYGTFQGCTNLTTVATLDTSNVTIMQSMFTSCSKLLTVGNFDTKNVTTMRGMFQNCSEIITIPQFNTSNVTTFQTMFQGCTKLANVPLFDVSKVSGVGLYNMFNNCPSLTDTSLNNILKSCTTVSASYTDTKTLTRLGFSSSNYSAERIQALSNYQAFIDAGWSIGY